MKVCVVTIPDYDYTEIIGIYTDEEKAIEANRKNLEKWGSRVRKQIEGEIKRITAYKNPGRYAKASLDDARERLAKLDADDARTGMIYGEYAFEMVEVQ